MDWSSHFLNILKTLPQCLSVCLSQQEQMADGARRPAALSPPFLLSASYSVDKEVLTKVLILLAVAAAVLAWVIEKATWPSKAGRRDGLTEGRTTAGTQLVTRSFSLNCCCFEGFFCLFFCFSRQHHGNATLVQDGVNVWRISVSLSSTLGHRWFAETASCSHATIHWAASDSTLLCCCLSSETNSKMSLKLPMLFFLGIKWLENRFHLFWKSLTPTAAFLLPLILTNGFAVVFLFVLWWQ